MKRGPWSEDGGTKPKPTSIQQDFFIMVLCDPQASDTHTPDHSGDAKDMLFTILKPKCYFAASSLPGDLIDHLHQRYPPSPYPPFIFPDFCPDSIYIKDHCWWKDERAGRGIRLQREKIEFSPKTITQKSKKKDEGKKIPTENPDPAIP